MAYLPVNITISASTVILFFLHSCLSSYMRVCTHSHEYHVKWYSKWLKGAAKKVLLLNSCSPPFALFMSLPTPSSSDSESVVHMKEVGHSSLSLNT